MIERTTKDMCVVCNDHGEPSCGYERRGLQYKCPFNDFIERGYELAKQDLGWHSVGDCLPERNHFVLVCVEDEGVPQCIGMAMLRDDGIWWDGEDLINVDCWMEVPQLQKEDKK